LGWKAADLLWRQPEMANELAAEVAGIVEADEGGDALHAPTGFLQQLSGNCQPNPLQVTDWGYSKVLAE
jgi:hypothetical protein